MGREAAGRVLAMDNFLTTAGGVSAEGAGAGAHQLWQPEASHCLLCSQPTGCRPEPTGDPWCPRGGGWQPAGEQGARCRGWEGEGSAICLFS